MELVDLLSYVYYGIALVGVSVIVWGSLVVFLRLLHLEFTRFKGGKITHGREALRHQLGSYLLLGLEFLIAADVVRTIFNPTLEEVAVLGGIVVIRTLISYFLDHELADYYRESGLPA